jgi:hypothetical protein
MIDVQNHLVSALQTEHFERAHAVLAHVRKVHGLNGVGGAGLGHVSSDSGSAGSGYHEPHKSERLAGSLHGLRLRDRVGSRSPIPTTQFTLHSGFEACTENPPQNCALRRLKGLSFS